MKPSEAIEVIKDLIITGDCKGIEFNRFEQRIQALSLAIEALKGNNKILFDDVVKKTMESLEKDNADLKEKLAKSHHLNCNYPMRQVGECNCQAVMKAELEKGVMGENTLPIGSIDGQRKENINTGKLRGE